MNRLRNPTRVRCDYCNGGFTVDENCLDRDEYGDRVNCPYCPNKTLA